MRSSVAIAPVATSANVAGVASQDSAPATVTHALCCTRCDAAVATIDVPRVDAAVLGAVFPAVSLILRMQGVKIASHELAGMLDAKRLAALVNLHCPDCQ